MEVTALSIPPDNGCGLVASLSTPYLHSPARYNLMNITIFDALTEKQFFRSRSSHESADLCRMHTAAMHHIGELLDEYLAPLTQPSGPRLAEKRGCDTPLHSARRGGAHEVIIRHFPAIESSNSPGDGAVIAVRLIDYKPALELSLQSLTRW